MSGEDRSEYRRKRRIRNQILCFILLIILLAIISVGAIFGISYINDVVKEKKAQKQAELLLKQQEEEEAAKAAEEELVIETPEIEDLEDEQLETEEVEEIVEVEETDWLEERVEASIKEIPLEDKVCGLFFVTPAALTGVDNVQVAGEKTQEALNKYAVGGLIYDATNIDTYEKLQTMISNTRQMSKYKLFFGIDEEGGSVAKVGKNLEVTAIPSMKTVGSTNDPSQAYDAGTAMGLYLKDLGFNVDFAPVTDVLTDPDNTTIGDRSFGSDASMVGQMAAKLAEGLQGEQVSACLKHFPGLGGTLTDTHKEETVSDRTIEQLRAEEFVAFSQGIQAGADFVMVSHMTCNGLGDEDPACLSANVVTNILRGELGYDGIVITDALNMGAITSKYDSSTAAVKTIEAGCDMILMPQNFEEAYNGLLEAVKNGTITEERIDESLKRIYRVKFKYE